MYTKTYVRVALQGRKFHTALYSLSVISDSECNSEKKIRRLHIRLCVYFFFRKILIRPCTRLIPIVSINQGKQNPSFRRFRLTYRSGISLCSQIFQTTSKVRHSVLYMFLPKLAFSVFQYSSICRRRSRRVTATTQGRRTALNTC